MKKVEDLKIKVIIVDGYKAACFPNSKDTKAALEIVKELGLDLAILSVPINDKDNIGHTFHFITEKGVNCKRLAQLFVEDGKKNDLYWKHNGIQGMNSARVHAANLNLIQDND